MNAIGARAALTQLFRHEERVGRRPRMTMSAGPNAGNPIDAGIASA